MERKVTFFVSSGKELGEPTRTELTLDYSGITEEQAYEYADDSCVIKWRATYKNSKKPYPRKDTYKVPAPGTRAVAKPMSDEEMIERLAMKMSASDIEAAIRAKIAEIGGKN